MFNWHENKGPTEGIGFVSAYVINSYFPLGFHIHQVIILASVFVWQVFSVSDCAVLVTPFMNERTHGRFRNRPTCVWFHLFILVFYRFGCTAEQMLGVCEFMCQMLSMFSVFPLRQGLNTLISASHCVCLCVVYRPLWLVSSPVPLRSKARDASCRSLPPVRPPATCERSSNRPRTSSVCLRERPFCSSTRYIALTSPSRSVTVQ